MSAPSRTRIRRPWVPWVRVALVELLAGGAVWGALELGHRYLGLQRLVIEQVNVTGCRGERLAEIQALARERVLGKPLFWFDAEGLRQAVENRPWVKGLLIRKDPPDRLSLVVEERQPLLWLARPEGVFLLAEDGVLLDRLAPSNLAPVPVVADPASQADAALVRLIRAASALRERQGAFYERLAELRWSARGPVAFLENVAAPIYLNRQDPAQNIPNFQALFLEHYAGKPELAQVRYFDLRWGSDVVVGNREPDEAPLSEAR